MSIVDSKKEYISLSDYIKLMPIERVVCAITTHDHRPIGTGFLISSDLILTSDHVRALCKGDRRNNKVLFDYYLASDGRIEGKVKELHTTQWEVINSPMSSQEQNGDFDQALPSEVELDYAILRLNEQVGNETVTFSHGEESYFATRGWIRMFEDCAEIDIEHLIRVLQHPAGRILKVSEGFIVGYNDNKSRLYHSANTEHVSSGSPCFNKETKLVAIHQGSRDDKTNRAIPIGLIVKHIEEELIRIEKQELLQTLHMGFSRHIWNKKFYPTTLDLRKFCVDLAEFFVIYKAVFNDDLLRLYYVCSLPTDEEQLLSFHLSTAIAQLALHPLEVNEQRLTILDFLQYLQISKPEFTQEIGEFIDRIVKLFRVEEYDDSQEFIANNYDRVKQKRNQLKDSSSSVLIRIKLNKSPKDSKTRKRYHVVTSLWFASKYIKPIADFGVNSGRELEVTLARLWSKKIVFYNALPRKSVQIGLVEESLEVLDWDIDQFKLDQTESLGDRKSTTICTKYPVWYFSIDRQEDQYKSRLERNWQLAETGGRVMSIRKRSQLVQDRLTSRLQNQKDNPVWCLVNIVPKLQEDERHNVYQLALLQGVPSLVWMKNGLSKVPKGLTKVLHTTNFNGVGELRKYVYSIAEDPNFRHNLIILFDDYDIHKALEERWL